MLQVSWLRAKQLLACGTREGRMFYRVDYVFAVMGAGFLIGLFTGRWTLRFTAACMAQAYFNTVIMLLALSSISLTFRLTLGDVPAWTGAIGDLSGCYMDRYLASRSGATTGGRCCWIARFSRHLGYRLR
jgi:hypothetical protein